MKFKSFEQYNRQYSNDINSFVNRVAIATTESIEFQYFDYIKNKYDLQENYKNIPIILTDDFTAESTAIYESNEFTYNINAAPSFDRILEDFKDASFTTNQTYDIKDIKKLKFPIIAYHKNGTREFKTIGQLRASEGVYEKFREKIIPVTKFKVLAFNGEPISIIETINNFPLDVDLKRFTLLNEVRKITKALYDQYNLDFYNVEIFESNKNKGLFINSIDKKLNLNPHQAFVVYEAVYNDYYSARIPNWVKNKMLNEDVIKYYKQKYLDSQLVKSSHTFNYSKYLNNTSNINESSIPRYV